MKAIFALIFATLYCVLAADFPYGQRVAGNLPYNDRFQIDGLPEETWKTNAGGRIMFRCVTGLNDYPIISHWTKDGKPLTRDIVKYQLINNGNTFLEIPRTSVKSEGNYTCTISTEFGVARKVFKLCVIARGSKEDCPAWWYDWDRP